MDIEKSDDDRVSVPTDVFHYIVQLAVKPSFDEDGYLSRYPDVEAAIAQGAVQSGFHHFVTAGIYEKRIPFACELDEDDYANRYEDVVKAVEDGRFASVREHFYSVGFREGRQFKLRNDESEYDDNFGLDILAESLKKDAA
ncbi:hypothetical protein [Parasphingopyxis sp.]|uniref:hypothetical protein n=1 Tax=Parasphingopyxis sp. TaxID=1920299 RepID=UPI00262C4675|nr:hypothetical protein [Parasphingopyxis sp.]